MRFALPPPAPPSAERVIDVPIIDWPLNPAPPPIRPAETVAPPQPAAEVVPPRPPIAISPNWLRRPSGEELARAYPERA